MSKASKRRNAVIAAVAAAALLAGGSTYALWSASTSLSGGVITAGNLDISAGTVSYWDVSGDRNGANGDESSAITPLDASGANLTALSDSWATGISANKAHAIGAGATDPSAWRMVPGDTVAVAIPYVLTLEGDNLVAGLSINPASVIGSVSIDAKDGNTPGSTTYGTVASGITKDNVLTWQFAVYDSAGKVLAPFASGPMALKTTDTSQFVAYFQAPNTGQAGGVAEKSTSIPFVNADKSSTTGTVTLVVYITFNDTTADSQARVDVHDAITLGSAISAKLQQVRCDGGSPAAGNFTTACTAS